MFFIGIDEAGYGPLLGPLVVGGVMLRCAGEPHPQYLWREFGEVIAEKPRKKEARLVICDSKKLSARPDGLALLEAGGLVAGRLAEVPTESCRSWLSALDPQVPEWLGCCPWDAAGDLALPCACQQDTLALHVSAVRHAMQRAGCSVTAIAATVLPPARYNDLVQKTGNKATVLWSATTWTLNRLLQRAASIAPDEPVVAILDRQGGRTDYRPALQRSFEPAELTVLQQSNDLGQYRMCIGNQAVDLTFMVDADLQCCVTAWGSIVAKYSREVCMIRLNEWWRTRVEDLAPTAGYLPDGRRFAERCQLHFARFTIDPGSMIRDR